MFRKPLLLLLMLLPLAASADDGHLLWLGNLHSASTPAKVMMPAVTPKVDNGTRATLALAQAELASSWQGSAVTLRLDTAWQLGEGYRLQITHSPQGEVTATVTARRAVGLLYGAYDLLRRQQLQYPGGTAADVDITEQPAFALRMLNHWDNLDGSVERGYAGRSIWKWEEVTQGRMTPSLRDRLTIYARANASLGINGTVINNVNASPKMLTREYLDKAKVFADLLRPYGIRVYLSINFASPMALGATKTADPLNAQVQRWWQQKAREIYKLIPDFGGFLVKANSEGQPGPGDYHRTHAQGANMLAEALRPYGGTVIWRSFVYGANHKGEDRVKQAVSEFKDLDGQFSDNVILQSKNGPLDFQPREPYAPIFDNIHRTPQMAEWQITQEYLGQSRHLVYLAPMWREFLSFVSAAGLRGVAGVANTGDDANWCGHPFSQANWYAFGRLAWNPQLTAEQIAREWVAQTMPQVKGDALEAIEDMMLTSREACVDYMMPMGLHHIFRFDHHYGPEPDGFKAEYPLEWCPVYYHKADSLGIGFDRTTDTGSGATAQYREPYATIYNKVETCPEEYLLWFHHLPWTYRLHSGRTLWQGLCDKYNEGVRRVVTYQTVWRSPLIRQAVDPAMWQHTDTLLQHQLDNAREWRKVCLQYFQTFSGMPIE
jgi:alpha-glucuronidase